MDPHEATKCVCVCERESKSVTAGIKMRLVSDSFNPRLKDSWFDRELRHKPRLLAEAVQERKGVTVKETEGQKKGGLKMVHLSPRSSTLSDLDMPG